MELNQLQKDVALQLKVTEDSITGWENNRTQPLIQYYPRIIGYLGYIPFKMDGKTIGYKILRYQQLNGLSQKKMGKLLRVHATTIASWEDNEFLPNKKLKKRIEKLLTR